MAAYPIGLPSAFADIAAPPEVSRDWGGSFRFPGGIQVSVGQPPMTPGGPGPSYWPSPYPAPAPTPRPAINWETLALAGAVAVALVLVLR